VGTKRNPQNEPLCEGTHLDPIHPSAWKVNSANFAKLDFSHLGTARVSMPLAFPLKGRRIRGIYTLCCSDLGKEVRRAPK
jgi:hypothetical protein